MFGKDDKQQQPQDSSDPLQAAMPDPISDDNLSFPPVTTPAFDAVASSPVLPQTPDLNTPELPATGTPDLPTEQADSAPLRGQPSDGADNALLNLKQQALQHLSPLVSQLDQTPEEKFRTTMMMIQASDDQTLIKAAFEAAQKIPDDKARAQALLDVINEINYFTQHSS